MTATYPMAEGFPGGLRCSACRRDIDDGQPYNSHPVGMTGEDLLTVLTCVYCPAPEEI